MPQKIVFSNVKYNDCFLLVLVSVPSIQSNSSSSCFSLFVFFLTEVSMRLFIPPVGLSILFSLSAKGDVKAVVWALRNPFTAQPAHNRLEGDWDERAGNTLSSGEICGLEAVMRDGQ